MADPQSPPYVAFFGVMGATSAMVFSGMYLTLCLNFVFHAIFIVILWIRSLCKNFL